jgi:hypothetical protein
VALGWIGLVGLARHGCPPFSFSVW